MNSIWRRNFLWHHFRRNLLICTCIFRQGIQLVDGHGLCASWCVWISKCNIIEIRQQAKRCYFFYFQPFTIFRNTFNQNKWAPPRFGREQMSWKLHARANTHTQTCYERVLSLRISCYCLPMTAKTCVCMHCNRLKMKLKIKNRVLSISGTHGNDKMFRFWFSFYIVFVLLLVTAHWNQSSMRTRWCLILVCCLNQCDWWWCAA